MKLFNWFKKKSKSEDLFCDFDSMMNMECPVINPLYITKVMEVLKRISRAYSHSLESRKLFLVKGGQFFDRVKDKHYEENYYRKEMRRLMERDFIKVVKEFCDKHEMSDVSIIVKSNLENMEKYDNELIGKLYHIQGLDK